MLTSNRAGYSTRRGHSILSDLSFRVRKGDIVAVCGPNGAGKTTLLKLLAGMYEPSSGEVLVGSVAPSRMNAMERARHLAIMGQFDVPDSRLCVRDFVVMGRLPLKVAYPSITGHDHDRLVDWALEKTGLASRVNSHIAELSGGELQRAKIAQFLCQEASILLLDEPTNHLDPKAKGEILSLLKGLGKTILCVMHDLTLVAEFASMCLLLNEGKLVAYDVPSKVLTEQQVRQFFGVGYYVFSHPSAPRTLATVDVEIK